MADYKKMENEGLEKEIAEKREALRKFRFAGAGSRSRNVREGRNLRREVAQMLTELSVRRIAQKPKNG